MWYIGKFIEKLNQVMSIGISFNAVKKSRKAIIAVVIVGFVIAIYVFCFDAGETKESVVDFKGQDIQFDNCSNMIENNQNNGISDDNKGLNVGNNLENNNGQINISGGGDITHVDVNYSQSLDKENLISKVNANIEYTEGNYEAAFKICNELSKSGDSTALENLGYFYANGIGTELDYKKASECYDAAFAKGNESALFNKFVLYVKNIRDYRTIIEILNIAYANKNEKIADYVSSLCDDSRNNMEILADIINMQDDELENYIALMFYKWRVIYNSFSSRTVLPTYSGNRWNEFLYSQEDSRILDDCMIRVYYYRVSEKYVVNDELLKDEYQYD